MPKPTGRPVSLAELKTIARILGPSSGAQKALDEIERLYGEGHDPCVMRVGEALRVYANPPAGA